MNAKQRKQYEATIKRYGLTLDVGKGHLAVLKDGKRVATVSSTGETNALRQSIRDLARLGLVGDEARRVKF